VSTCTLGVFSSTTFCFSYAVGACDCSSSEVGGVLQIFLLFLAFYFSLLLVAVVLVELVFPVEVVSIAVYRVC